MCCLLNNLFFSYFDLLPGLKQTAAGWPKEKKEDVIKEEYNKRISIYESGCRRER